MFEQSSIGRTRKAWTVPLSFAGQLVVVAAAAVAPLLLIDPPTLTRLAAPFSAPPIQPGTPKGGGHGNRVTLVAVPPVYKPHTVFAPAFVPHHLPGPVLEEPPEIASGCTGGDCGPGPIGIRNGVPGGLEPPPGQRIVPPPPPVAEVHTPAVTRAPKPDRIRVGGLVQESRILHRVLPVYPTIATKNRISGVVLLKAIIGIDGQVRELRALSGHPLLAPAAVEAVRQWTYWPALLNGNPVEVDTEITVKFNLTER